ncbi:initiator tRNA phosphoribosyl transferase [Jaminaea rosea]|uniref:Initiator tRNA phosphoribosyl transferase n=1 Tax=Jaminaea rosea TaxID=1569628 RepID=A0A316V2W5_9BASI|nr:initiator tRNA phosphoribosyl transferase [Jaminaea rosea]PWN30523.1 initiator tRNA phosphoribosyl transferase [Jaminaea rosea]
MPYAVPLTTDDRKVLRPIERNPWNRLHSIDEDARWVQQVVTEVLRPRLPVVANLRCGAWYVPSPPDGARRPFCYFKSTDGHAGEWSFSLKRPNLEMLHLIQAQGGAVIVDSTRRGKSMPDALSKTIPIWCAVMNEASTRRHGQPSKLADEAPLPWPCRSFNRGSTGLLTPAHQVPPSEHAQMEERFEGWIASLLASDLPILKLDRPLVPYFLTRREEDHSRSDRAELPSTGLPVILISASRRVEAPTPSDDGSYYYTQGSGDDEEAWSRGLTPDLFWQEREMLLRCRREELAGMIAEIVRGRTERCSKQRASDVQIKGTKITLGIRDERHAFNAEERGRYALLIHCNGSFEEEEPPSVVVNFKIPPGKAGLSALRSGLSQVVDTGRAPTNGDILIIDTTFSDALLAFAVALLASLYTSGRQRVADVAAHCLTLSKDDVRRRLQWVQHDLPGANPSRAAMQRVDEVVLRRPGGSVGTGSVQADGVQVDHT